MLKILKKKDYKKLTADIVDLRVKLENTQAENQKLLSEIEKLEKDLKRLRTKKKDTEAFAKRKWLNAEYGEDYNE